MQTLLILDNVEHLLTATDSVLFPLHDTNVHILATSHTPLQIEGETTVPLSGLSRDRAALLFVERARRIVPTFATGDDTTQLTADIGDICEQVGGLPLGIELAASWVEHFSVAEIGQSLAQIEVEPKQADELVLRHHSLSSLLEHSWRLLDPELQQVLIRFSVLRGGFDRMAAATVADSGLSDLSALIGHSLGRAVAACQLGMRDEAQALIEETLEYVVNHGLQGLVEPVLLLLNCERVLTEVGQSDRSRQVLCQAEEWVEAIAGRISDEVVRESFLNNRPDNQLLRTRLALLIQ